MTGHEYQSLANRTAGDSRLTILALGLTGEAGEVADHIKKYAGHGHRLDSEAIKKELGDIMWYIAAMCEKLGFCLDDVMKENIEKLRKRYPEGFSVERSVNRDK